MSGGFIPLWRKLYSLDHPLAPSTRDPSNRRDAWLDICQLAQHTEYEHAGERLQRGEVMLAVRTCGERWGWSKSRVARFLQWLASESMIGTVRGTPSGTVYRIVNYDTYAVLWDTERDSQRDTERDSSGTAAGQEQPQTINQTLSPTNAREEDSEFQALARLAVEVHLGKHAEVVAAVPGAAVHSIKGLYLPLGTDERVWGTTPLRDRPPLLATAIHRWLSEGHDRLNGKFFRRILETVIREGDPDDRSTRSASGATGSGTKKAGAVGGGEKRGTFRKSAQG